MIPQAAPARRIARFRRQVDEAVAAVLGGEAYVLGAPVEGFEAAFARFCGAGHCVGVASGTDAIALALRALGIGPGDEVIVPALTFAGTAQAVLHCGAQPRLVDVDPRSRCIDPAAAEAAITPRTAAIVPVHLFGHPADMPALTALAGRHGLAVVEDCAQSHGASLGGRPLGSFGNAAATSFYPTKNLGGVGDGGAVTTDDPALAARLRALRYYGFAGPERLSLGIGFNSRLDALQAAILGALLPHLADGNAERRAIAADYRARLDLDGLGLPPEGEGSVYHQFAVTHPRRDALAAHLAAAGIGTAVHYAPGLHRHPAFLEAAAGPLPVTEALSASLLSLPIQPEVAAGAPEAVARALAGFAS
ncbi:MULTISPECIES: DegT/DnrJ/EryC1/StrS family aminotransferase [Methylobacterium]|uniref:dTDP-3-amino-3,6-dideoxy-alpha-D-galactopyranose transaminase n=3 Tax=Pseudomonadota TaxID=1224 RepID=A0ABQ4STU1_9HYPH|nr:MULTISPECIES: DegT/DnrJ/EryC1/StrS family aminotransferase [Methylobacterium]PIU06963.1 MAG: DegT/DnrJ/EryC1/StrS family aminotransferase [Methylobacterium sp. CG09_land_8_20_14_0_10_71_15]PIU16175.1 MAG: DegT/DnrJ/EryC1/StrS family aminotransferase [Methylobacterium sp. CG08_land_8_20_14_0_20_71_15]GBU18087.1 aminotransferase [Methylobacterium sp.]GJE05091.1 dTDP-3-amino-3,6-dideoxy-alpha-D-galactopyranose transaminase [Methylobacterium jeotgali]